MRNVIFSFVVVSVLAATGCVETDKLSDAEVVKATYEYRYAGGTSMGEQVYVFSRKDGERIDAKNDRLLLEYFDAHFWQTVADRYILEDVKDLPESGVLLTFSTWDWVSVEEKLQELDALAPATTIRLVKVGSNLTVMKLE